VISSVGRGTYVLRNSEQVNEISAGTEGVPCV